MTVNTLVLVAFYLLVTTYFARNWVSFFQNKDNFSPEEMFLSLVVLIIATFLWPLVIPISVTQALQAKKLEISSVAPVFLVIVVVGVLTLSSLFAFTIAKL